MTPDEAILALQTVNLLLGLAERTLAQARERGELTPEQEAAADAQRAKVFARPEWKRND